MWELGPMNQPRFYYARVYYLPLHGVFWQLSAHKWVFENFILFACVPSILKKI
jgi:hypothetical protein